MPDVIVIDGEQLRTLVPMADAIQEVRQAFADLAANRIVGPQRTTSPDGRTLVMLAQSRDQPGVALKVLSVRPANPELGLATLQGAILWLDGQNGHLSALIEGSSLTALRTGAASGVATALLSSPDSKVLAMFGAGAQAPDQIRAVCCVRAIREVKIVSGGRRSGEALAGRMRSILPGVAFQVVDKAAAALEDADVVCTATPSSGALFRLRDLPPSAHINAIGAHRPDMQEISPEIFAAADVVAVDSREAALLEAGDAIQAIRSGDLHERRLQELGTLLTGRSGIPHRGISIFKSVGVAAQDWAVARLAVERGMRRTELQRVRLG